MGLYLVASAIEMADRSGLAGEHSAVASAAETMREVRASDDPLGIAGDIERAMEAIRRIANAFEDAGNALE
jgi:hypothetical protein